MESKRLSVQGCRVAREALSAKGGQSAIIRVLAGFHIENDLLVDRIVKEGRIALVAILDAIRSTDAVAALRSLDIGHFDLAFLGRRQCPGQGVLEVGIFLTVGYRLATKDSGGQ